MKHSIKRVLSIFLCAALVLSLALPAFATGPEGEREPKVTWEKIGESRATPITENVTIAQDTSTHSPKDVVRVSIVLKEEGTLGRGWSTRGIADNSAAMAYRAGLKAAQKALEKKISSEILNGEPLDVVWNITLAANMISANVEYGKIAAIEALDEVKAVVLEARYEPAQTDGEDGDEPNMYRSVLQTGTDTVWAQGITGAGSRVAVIDTGIEVDHRSFSGPALEYSLQQNAAGLDMEYEAYLESLGLLTAAEVQSHLEELNVQIDPDTTYISTKIPYAYNYVDDDYDVTHRNDTEGNHGSHVEGIAASNKYAPDGDGFVEAANGNNKVKGQAYDAQILTMKVFGKGGGAFDSDYMVAIEDAIVLGADSVNLSLGSSSPGMATSPEYQSILDSLTESDTLVCISMGNSYQWSYAAGGPSRNLYYDDANYYTGGSPGSFANAFTVASVGSGNANANGRYSMSSFSSWGVPSDLSLKPEITAPGGNVLSVNGNNTTGYTTMSGTSMAAPQITGIAALVAQYIRENDLAGEGISVRQLSQSLIMSTAAPIHMNNNNYIYYPVIQQGAGLARADKALAAKTYVLIDPESLPARAPLSAKSNVLDGKVKVELGDDPDYIGVYSFAYSLNNLTDEPVIYQLAADFFTQNITGSGNSRARAQTIVMLNAGLTWSVDGQPIDQIPPEGLYDLTGDGQINEADAQAILDLCAGLIEEIPVNADKADLDGDGDVDTYDAYLLLKDLADAAESENYVTVPAGGSVKIGLIFDLKDSIENYNYNGNYVEGYVWAREIAASDAETADHSIPVVGYYGSWTDFSMFNKGSYLEYTYGGETRNPYLNSVLGAATAKALQTFLLRYAGEEFGTPIGGNPVVAESYYDENRNAIASAYGDEIFSVHYSAIRNAAASRFRVMQEGVEEPIAEIVGGSAFGAYYNSNDRSWYNTNAMPDINYFLPESVPNNAKLTLSFELAPEYYVRADGTVDWEALHDGAKITLPITVDNEAPAIVDVAVATSDISGAQKLILTAKDNQYIAAFRLLKEDGTVLVSQGSDPNAAPNDEYTVSYALTDDTEHYLVEVTDYALNVGTYRINFNKDELEDPEITLTLDKTDLEIIGKGSEKLTATISPWGVEDEVTWTTSDPAVATVNGRGVVTGVETGTAVITATSAAYPGVSATATVHVRFIEKTLNGIVCDEHGAAYVIEFTMRNLPEYETLHEDPLDDWVYETAIDKDGTVYVSTYDGSNQSPLYTIDLNTMEMTKLGNGTSRTYYTDIEAPGDAIYEKNVLLGVYSTNLYTINKADGSRASSISMTSYTGSGSLVGITFYKTEENVDHYLLLTQSGIVHDVGVALNEEGAVTVVSAEQVLNYGYTAETNYWQDLYFDGESLYWSRIDLGISRVDIIMAENFETDGAEAKIIRAGSFAVDVWPVGGLFELSKVPGYTSPEPEPEPVELEDGYYLIGPDWTTVEDIHHTENFIVNPANEAEYLLTATLDEGEQIKVAKVENNAIAAWYPDGFDNEYTVDAAHAGSVNVYFKPDGTGGEDWHYHYFYVEAVTTEPEPGNGVLNAVLLAEPDDVSTGKTIRITADEPTTNGLITVAFPETVQFVSAESSALMAVKDETGKVTLSFADAEPFDTGELVILLTFTDDSIGQVTVTTEERNDGQPEEEPAVVDLGGVIPPTPSEDGYDESPDWVWADDYSMAEAVFHSLDSGEDLVLPAQVTAEVTEPTCTEDGAEVYTAVVYYGIETYTDVQTVILPALGHDYSEAVWTWNEELTAASVTFTCSRCGDEQTVEAELESATVEPDCTTPGLTTITATAQFEDVPYTDVKAVNLEALGHDWDEGTEIAAPGCANAGVTVFTCQRCGETHTEAVDALGHDPQAVEALDPTCTEPGHTAGSVCARCGAVLEGLEELPALGHSVVIDEAVAPTCTEPGLTAGAHCSVCNEVLAAQETVEALGHDPQAIPAVEPSCTEAGSTAGTVCARCGEVLEAPEPVEALGHEPQVIPAVEPTCTEPGSTAGTVCARCGEILEAPAVIPATGHELEMVPGVAPTCTEPGTTYSVRCAVCGEILYPAETLAPTGHAYGDPEWTWNEELTAASAKFVCARCGDEQILEAEITEAVITEAAPHIAGEKKLTAAVEFEGETYTDEKTVELEALPCPCAAFEDMPEYGTPEHEAIDWAFTRDPQITAGMNETTFGIGQTLTRAQAATFLYAAAGKPAFDVENAENPFTDVKDGKWYTTPVLWAYSEGLVSGMNATTYGVNGTLTRGQILVILYAWAGKPSVEGLENPYADVPAGKWYTDAAVWAYHAGIERGDEGVYSQSAPCLRETMVLYLYRYLTGNQLLTD